MTQFAGWDGTNPGHGCHRSTARILPWEIYAPAGRYVFGSGQVLKPMIL